MSEMQALTPVGRIVAGKPMVHEQGSYNGILKTKKDGSPKIESFIGVAIAKTDPATAPIIQGLQQVAAATGQAQHPNFSIKFDDGDLPEFAGKEGYAGCYVLKFSSGYPIPYRQNDANYTPIDPIAIEGAVQPVKKGDWVKVAFTAKPGTDQKNPSIFLNPQRVLFMQPGEPIVSGPSDADLFGAAGSHTVGGAPAVGGTPAVNTQAVTTPAVTTPAVTTPAVTAASEATAAGANFLNPTAQTTPVTTPPPITQAPAPTDMNAYLHPDIKAQGHTYESLRAQFDDAAMKSNGWLLDEIQY